MAAIWNSYSKSETARSPRMITWAPTSSARCIRRLWKDRTSTSVSPVSSSGSTSSLAPSRAAPRSRTCGALPGIAGDRDDQSVDHPGGAHNDVLVALGDRIEGAGIESDELAVRSCSCLVPLPTRCRLRARPNPPRRRQPRTRRPPPRRPRPPRPLPRRLPRGGRPKPPARPRRPGTA